MCNKTGVKYKAPTHYFPVFLSILGILASSATISAAKSPNFAQQISQFALDLYVVRKIRIISIKHLMMINVSRKVRQQIKVMF